MTTVTRRGFGHAALPLAAALALGAPRPVPGARAAEADDAAPQAIVDGAEEAFAGLVADPNMTWLRDHLGDARGLLIVPTLVNAGFFLGGSGGNGVLLARGEGPQGWSHPAFYTVGSASFGLQIGAEVAEVVMLLMTERATDSVLASSVKLGADLGVAAGPVGVGASGTASEDVVAFSRAKGLYGGMVFQGSLLNVRDDLNGAYYGTPVSPRSILLERRASNPGADSLRATVAKATAGTT